MKNTRPLANRLKNRLKNRNTKPLNITLVNLAASKLTPNQMKQLFALDPVLYKRTTKAVEHRAANLRSIFSNVQNYLRKKYRR